MTQLETLIQTLCPNGVKFVKLGEVVRLYKGVQMNKTNLHSSGLYPVMNGGVNPSGYLDQYNEPNNTIAISQGGASAGNVTWMTVNFWAGAHCYIIRSTNEQLLCNKYLYYFVKQKESILKQCQYGAGIPALGKSSIESLQIPLPPLAVQSEIVRILDKFTLYKSELAAELAARLQQYEYYREQLLTFDDTVKRVKLGEVGFYPTGRIAINEVESYVGVENLLKDRNGVEFLEKTPKMDVAIQFLPNDILIGNIRPYLKKIWMADRKGGTNGDVVTVRIKPEFIDKVNPKYLYHQLASDMFFNYDNINAKGAKMPRGDKNAILQYSIPLPPLSEQERIVSILDRFDKLCHDIREGLPAEIDLRQKQYEHYRDKLLTFG